MTDTELFWEPPVQPTHFSVQVNGEQHDITLKVKTNIDIKPFQPKPIDWTREYNGVQVVDNFPDEFHDADYPGYIDPELVINYYVSDSESSAGEDDDIFGDDLDLDMFDAFKTDEGDLYKSVPPPKPQFQPKPMPEIFVLTPEKNILNCASVMYSKSCMHNLKTPVFNI